MEGFGFFFWMLTPPIPPAPYPAFIAERKIILLLFTLNHFWFLCYVVSLHNDSVMVRYKITGGLVRSNQRLQNSQVLLVVDDLLIILMENLIIYFMLCDCKVLFATTV